MNKEKIIEWFHVLVVLWVVSICIIMLVKLAIILGIIKFPTPDTIPVCMVAINNSYLTLVPNSTDYYKCKKGGDLYIIPAYKTVVK